MSIPSKSPFPGMRSSMPAVGRDRVLVLRCAVAVGKTRLAAVPNPSIERTVNSRLRRLSPAAHVER